MALASASASAHTYSATYPGRAIWSQKTNNARIHLASRHCDKNDYPMAAYIHLLFITIVSNIFNLHAFRCTYLVTRTTPLARAGRCVTELSVVVHTMLSRIARTLAKPCAEPNGDRKHL